MDMHEIYEQCRASIMAHESRPTRRDPRDRYLHDPSFAQLVTLIEALLGSGEWTPTELREAVILAATRHEMMRPPGPMFVPVEPPGVGQGRRGAGPVVSDPDFVPPAE